MNKTASSAGGLRRSWLSVRSGGAALDEEAYVQKNTIYRMVGLFLTAAHGNGEDGAAPVSEQGGVATNRDGT